MGGIGSGAKKKIYPLELVGKVKTMYEAGATQTEIGFALGLTQRVIWKIMDRHELQTRVAAKRNQWGDRNHAWKGENAKYQAFHMRVETRNGKPMQCSVCGTDDPTRWFDWANLTGKYHDPSDYARMCRSCHRQYDKSRRQERTNDPANAS